MGLVSRTKQPSYPTSSRVPFGPGVKFCEAFFVRRGRESARESESARANVSHTHGLIHEDEDSLKKILLVYTHMTLHVL